MLGTAIAFSVSLGASIAPSQAPLLASQHGEPYYLGGTLVRNPVNPSEISMLNAGRAEHEGVSTRSAVDYGVITRDVASWFGDVKFDAVFNDLLDYVTLEEGWDGYAGSRPSVSALTEAASFLDLLFKMGSKAPVATISPSGEVGVYWRANDIYCEVGFVGDGVMSYFAEDQEGSILGDVDYSEGTVPPPLFDFLKRHFIRLDNGDSQQAA